MLDNRLPKFALSYLKKAAVLLVIWATGYFQCEPFWLLGGLAVHVWMERRREGKHPSSSAREDPTASAPLPGGQREKWMNEMIDQLWPHFVVYVQTLLQEMAAKSSLPVWGFFKCTEIDPGKNPPRIDKLEVHASRARPNEMNMDLEINYAGDSKISVGVVPGFKYGIKNLVLHGKIRVIFRPLMTRLPLIGGMNICFLDTPKVNFDLTGWACVLNSPGLRNFPDMLRCAIQELIASTMVLPKRLAVQLSSDVDVKKLRCPMPQGVLRVRVVKAKNLQNAYLGIGIM